MSVAAIAGHLPFQSTPPTRAATHGLPVSSDALMLVSIHAAHAGGDTQFAGCPACDRVSIHAAHEGGDVRHAAASRRVTVSIHAAHAGGDSTAAALDA